MNDLLIPLAKNTSLHLIKIVPGIKFTFKQKSPRSTIRKYIQWKTFFINEDNFSFHTDTVVIGADTSLKQRISLVKNDYQVNQLQFVLQNTRALYPFNYQFSVEQIK
jgi:hypothetical protein